MTHKKNHSLLMHARAIHELQLQMGIGLRTGDRIHGVCYAAEFIDTQALAAMAPNTLLLLSSERAEMLGIATENAPMALTIQTLNLSQLHALILGSPQFSFRENIAPAPECASTLIALAKEAGLLPAIIWVPDQHPDPSMLVIDTNELHHPLPMEVQQGDVVALPLEGAENSTLTSFRSVHDGHIHLALMVGGLDQRNAPLVRVHSSCVTGDLLGSLRCDCGGQLQAALKQMKEEGAGILLYLHQEGRNIGINNKLRAYALQEQGLDTYDANKHLGFAEDERDFSIAAAILQALGHTTIRLLTNNPDKTHALESLHIKVKERVPLIAGETEHNQAYLEAKRTRRGHHH